MTQNKKKKGPLPPRLADAATMDSVGMASTAAGGGSDLQSNNTDLIIMRLGFLPSLPKKLQVGFTQVEAQFHL